MGDPDSTTDLLLDLRNEVRAVDVNVRGGDQLLANRLDRLDKRLAALEGPPVRDWTDIALVVLSVLMVALVCAAVGAYLGWW